MDAADEQIHQGASQLVPATQQEHDGQGNAGGSGGGSTG